MEKTYQHTSVEEKWYKFWEESGYFTPKTDPEKKPFTVILPPPNANADLHMGHSMYVIEDIMVRYHRMLGDSTLWLPGADHAGFETQFVFEKHLAKEDKSRFDFPRETLYKMIWDFVHKNRGNMEHQLRRLGFSLDWTRQMFTLDPRVVKIVYRTFNKLYNEGLIYRSQRLVNYCTRDGTSFSDLEVKYVERKDPLYYLKYGPFVLATTRPETKFGDTAVAVHPKDKRYKDWIGKEIEVEGLIGKFKIVVIGDTAVDPKFGTGVVKVTPAHDMADFEMGVRHHLPMKLVIGYNGKLTDLAGPYKGMNVMAARAKVVEDLKAKGLIDHIDENYIHNVGTCYKCGRVIEPLPLPQWYIRVAPLTKSSADAIRKKKITFVPKRFTKTAIRWLTNFHDWNISRQIVWGIRIPAWICNDCSKNGKEVWTVTDGSVPKQCTTCKGTNLTQDTDTFDTWFSSGQWPFATLESNSKNDLSYFYPTSVMETGYDILPWWVCRMIMLGLYVMKDVPFRSVYLHGLIRDSKGQKMSKSKGNVINPLQMTDLYGADALRFALVYGTAAGTDLALSEDRIRGMRNFSNKLWNIGRFLKMNQETMALSKTPAVKRLNKENMAMQKTYQLLVRSISKDIESYKFGQAAEKIYEFIWHTFADKFIEQSKELLHNGDKERLDLLISIFTGSLKLLHPFMPFITEEIYQQLNPSNKPLITSSWPTKE